MDVYVNTGLEHWWVEFKQEKHSFFTSSTFHSYQYAQSSTDKTLTILNQIYPILQRFAENLFIWSVFSYNPFSVGSEFRWMHQDMPEAVIKMAWSLKTQFHPLPVKWIQSNHQFLQKLWCIPKYNTKKYGYESMAHHSMEGQLGITA